MAKLNTTTSASRQAAALADDAPPYLHTDEDDAFLRLAAPATPQRRSPRGTRLPGPTARLHPAEEAEAFLRSRRRVLPRKTGWWPRLLGSRLGRILLVTTGLLLLAGLGTAAWAVRSFLQHDPHFRIESSASIEATGATELSRAELVRVFGSDIGRNIFFVPLAQREAALEAEPWVKHATVMRLLPSTLRVAITERTPVAFVRIGRDIQLVDEEGVVLGMAPSTLAARHYSFPVVTGLEAAATPEARAERMRLFRRFVAELDAGGSPISAQLSEVDLSNAEDVRAVVPAQGSDILLHFGNSDFLERYRSYQEHLAEWRQQYPNLSAVDLRYDRQVVLKMADAAQADEAVEAHPLPALAGGPATGTSVPRHAPSAKHLSVAVPPRAVAAPHHVLTAPQRAGSPAAGHGSGAGRPRVWYTAARSGLHGAQHWVAHTMPRTGQQPSSQSMQHPGGIQ